MKFVMAACTVLLLTGCMQSTPKYWQHSTVPSSQWKSDHNRCKRAAEKYLGLDGRYDAAEASSSYDAKMRTYEAGKKQKKLVADCMRKLGYVPMQ